jgi:hypothetical protein
MFILDEEELERLTGFTRKAAQVRALNQMGVPHRVRLDGQPIVTADAVNAFIGVISTPVLLPAEPKLNFAALNKPPKKCT